MMTSPAVKASAENSIADGFANMEALRENTGFDASFTGIVLLVSLGLVDKETETFWDVIYDEHDDRIYLRTNAKERVVPGDVAK